MAVNEATIQERNTVTETQPQARIAHLENFQAARTHALEAADRLIVLAKSNCSPGWHFRLDLSGRA